MLNKPCGHYSCELSRHVSAPLYLYISSLFIIKEYWINFIDKGEVAPGKKTSRYKRYTENGKKKCHNWHTKPIHIWHRELKSLQIPGCLINIRRSQNKRSPPNLGRPQKLIRVINQGISGRATAARTYLKTCNFKDREQSTLYKCMLR